MQNAMNGHQTSEKSVGNRLKKLRLDYEDENIEKGKLTQEKLAKIISARQTGKRLLSPQHIGRIERGDSPLSYKYAVLFSEFFNVRLQWFLYGAGPKTDAEAEAIEVEKKLSFVRKFADKKIAVWSLISAIAEIRGFEIDEIPRSMGADFSTHLFHLVDNEHNEFVYQDDGLIDRIRHYAELEVNAFIDAATRNSNGGAW